MNAHRGFATSYASIIRSKTVRYASMSSWSVSFVSLMASPLSALRGSSFRSTSFLISSNCSCISLILCADSLSRRSSSSILRCCSTARSSSQRFRSAASSSSRLRWSSSRRRLSAASSSSRLCRSSNSRRTISVILAVPVSPSDDIFLGS